MSATSDPVGESPGVLRRASLEVLRAEALDELSTVVFERLRAGEDPWAFMEQIPSVDQLVVLTLRAELIRADNERMPSPDVQYRMLRQIALAYPALTETVWKMLDDRESA
ncbi:MAG TPA: tryptophan synthase subunit alpha [Pseudolysinimonas sp.]|nr:tryptophan synthase subunit alpha [Pseudolysinimonas sp.]